MYRCVMLVVRGSYSCNPGRSIKSSNSSCMVINGDISIISSGSNNMNIGVWS